MPYFSQNLENRNAKIYNSVHAEGMASTGCHSSLVEYRGVGGTRAPSLTLPFLSSLSPSFFFSYFLALSFYFYVPLHYLSLVFSPPPIFFYFRSCLFSCSLLCIPMFFFLVFFSCPYFTLFSCF